MSCETVKPQATVPQPPPKQPEFDDVNALVQLFPSNMPVDSFALQAEFGNFVSHVLGHVNLTKRKLENLAAEATFSEECKSAFPLKAFRLLMTCL